MSISLVLPSFRFTKTADTTVVGRNVGDRKRGSVQSCTKC
jgi:hypothetical protein